MDNRSDLLWEDDIDWRLIGSPEPEPGLATAVAADFSDPADLLADLDDLIPEAWRVGVDGLDVEEPPAPGAYPDDVARWHAIALPSAPGLDAVGSTSDHHDAADQWVDSDLAVDDSTAVPLPPPTGPAFAVPDDDRHTDGRSSTFDDAQRGFLRRPRWRKR